VLERIRDCDGHPDGFRYLTGCRAESADTFRAAFERETGTAFTPDAFRAHRLRQLDQADVFVNIRAGMSESSAFELSYHVFRGACTPILFLVWKQAPIKTTLLKDLGSLCDVTYLEFDDPAELDAPLAAFFRSCERGRRGARPALARAGA
jgi:carbamoyl-phosphate synthase large subunit